MAENKPAVPVADCEAVDTKTDAEDVPIQLCMFMPPAARSPVWAIERTARYAQDPVKYLKDILGLDVFENREHLLHIPEELDRDFYGIGKHKQAFEQHIATLLGKQHGLFFITGVQAQLAALKFNCDQSGNNRVAWHVTSHLEEAEEQAWNHLYGLHRILLGRDPEQNPEVADILEVLSLPEDQRPAAVLLEIPNRALGCKTYTLEQLQIISEECRKANVKLHLDGARLWEIEPYYQDTAGKSFADIGALFDSVYVSFYKGLNGAGGAILASNDSSLITEAKIWQRRAGGNVFTLLYQVIDDERGFNENIGAFGHRRKNMIDIASRITEATKHFKTQAGLAYVQFVPETPTCCQTHTMFQGFTSEQLVKARDSVEKKTRIRVFEKLRSKKSVDQRMKEDRAAAASGKAPEEEALDDQVHFIEWMIMSETEKIDTEVFARGYVALCGELRRTFEQQ